MKKGARPNTHVIANRAARPDGGILADFRAIADGDVGTNINPGG